MDPISLIAAVVWILAGTGGITVVIVVDKWLRFSRYIYDKAVEHGETPKAAEVIQAASQGIRAAKVPAFPPPPKSDETSLAA